MSLSDPRLLDHDPVTGITEYYHFDPTDHSFTIETRQDISGLIEVNKRLANDTTGRYGEFDKVASYPMVIWQDLKTKGILDNQRDYRRWLNDRDNQVFRTRMGKI